MQATRGSEVAMIGGRLVLTVQGAMLVLGISESTFHDWQRKGHLATIKVAGRTYVEVAEADRLSGANLVQR